MAPRLFIRDSGGNPRQIKRLFLRNGASIPQQIKRLFIRDSGGHARLVFQYADLLTLVAQAYTSLGFDVVGYGRDIGGGIGTLTPDTLGDGMFVVALYYSDMAPIGPAMNLAISGFGSDPTASYLNTLLINSQTLTGSGASTYSYGGGQANWQWLPGFPLTGGVTYPVVLTRH